MIRRMRESNGNVFYCAECTYDKSNGTMFLYTTDITEVRGSVKPKDSMKVEGGFLVRRKYFRSEYEAQDYIDSLPNAMPMSRNESFDPTPLKTAKVYRPDFDSFDLFSCDESTKNQFLGRFVHDCEYFLGNGYGYEGHLWAGSVEEQIDLMRKLYHDIRPDWLSEKQIDDYEDAMLAIKYNKNESIRRTKRIGLSESFDGIDGYAVDIHDMGKSYHHLLLFSNLDDAEYAYDQLDDISESDANEDEIAVDLGVIIDTCDEVVNEIDWRREIDKNDVWTAGDDTRYQIIGNVDLWIYW